MTSRVSHTSIDCHNAYELSEWWKQVLGYEDIPDDPNEPGHEECMIRSGAGGHHILFIEVPEPKSVKNRIHFDLRSTDVTQDEEYERLLDDNPSDVNTLNRIGDLWVRINRNDEAVKVFGRIADHLATMR